MQTECPHCHTLFRISEAQLEAASGLVECGYCHETFDASARVDNAIVDNVNQLDVFETPPQADAPRADANTAQAAAEDAVLAGPAAGQRDALTESAKMLLQGETNAVIPDAYRVEGPAHSTLSTLAWSVACLVLIVALLAQYTWFNRHHLAGEASLKPLLESLCQRIDCGLLGLRDPEQIELVSRNVYTHPNTLNALMISTTIVNSAPFAQPYPSVQIDFSDVRGGLLASRRFAPGEYMELDASQLRSLRPEEPVSFNLEILDPGEQAITYEFSFH